MNKLNTWILRKIAKKLVIQGYTHKSNITKYYQIMFDAAEAEFTEDNPPELEGFLEDCFYAREQGRKNKMKLEDWVREKQLFNCIRDHWIKVIRKAKGLHVIGTCGECKETDENGFLKDGYCPRLDTFLNIPIIDFGCIHFQEKEI